MNPLRQLLYVMNDSHFMTTVRLHDFHFKSIYLCSIPPCQLNSLYWCFNCLIIIMIYFSFWGRCDKEAQWSCCLHSREVLGLDLCSDPPVGGGCIFFPLWVFLTNSPWFIEDSKFSASVSLFGYKYSNYGRFLKIDIHCIGWPLCQMHIGLFLRCKY